MIFKLFVALFIFSKIAVAAPIKPYTELDKCLFNCVAEAINHYCMPLNKFEDKNAQVDNLTEPKSKSMCAEHVVADCREICDEKFPSDDTENLNEDDNEITTTAKSDSKINEDLASEDSSTEDEEVAEEQGPPKVENDHEDSEDLNFDEFKSSVDTPEGETEIEDDQQEDKPKEIAEEEEDGKYLNKRENDTESFETEPQFKAEKIRNDYDYSKVQPPPKVFDDQYSSDLTDTTSPPDDFQVDNEISQYQEMQPQQTGIKNSQFPDVQNEDDGSPLPPPVDIERKQPFDVEEYEDELQEVDVTPNKEELEVKGTLPTVDTIPAVDADADDNDETSTEGENEPSGQLTPPQGEEAKQEETGDANKDGVQRNIEDATLTMRIKAILNRAESKLKNTGNEIDRTLEIIKEINTLLDNESA